MEYFASSRGFALSRRNMEAEPAGALAKKAEGNQRSTLLFRYRDSPEEIQEEC